MAELSITLLMGLTEYFFMDLSLQIVSFNSQENRLSGST